MIIIPPKKEREKKEREKKNRERQQCIDLITHQTEHKKQTKAFVIPIN